MVSYTVQDSSMWQLHLDVVGAPDTTHIDHPGGALRPMGVSMGVGQTGGVWSVSIVNVFGQKVKDGKVVTKRNYPLPFTDPLGEDSEAPEWLRKICQDWTDKANGVGGGGARLTEPEPTNYARQAFDTALNVLLIRENLEGTQWAIEKLREMAKGPELGASGLNHIADGLDSMLDKRTAELAARDN
jgi:hypothetical protein